jgi:hypothetical protein
MAGPALSEEVAEGRLRRQERARLIQAAAPASGWGTLRFPPAALLASRVLGVLDDLGVADRELMGHASRALYGREAWQPQATLTTDGRTVRKPDGTPLYVSPVFAAACGAAIGQHWEFALSVYIGADTGRRVVRAWTYDTDGDWQPDALRGDPDEDLIPSSTTTILLPAILGPLHQRMTADLPRLAAERAAMRQRA